jgi:ketosteroid isomerase-like protein
MKTGWVLRSCMMGLLGAVAFLGQAAQAADVRAEIVATDVSFSAAAAKGDSAALAALYSVDAQVMPAGSEPIRGREAIEKFWRGALGSGIADVRLQTLDVFGSGATATEVGHYELRDKAGKTLDRGKYIVVWRREHGHLRLVRDMFSTDLPPPKG